MDNLFRDSDDEEEENETNAIPVVAAAVAAATSTSSRGHDDDSSNNQAGRQPCHKNGTNDVRSNHSSGMSARNSLISQGRDKKANQRAMASIFDSSDDEECSKNDKTTNQRAKTTTTSMFDVSDDKQCSKHYKKENKCAKATNTSMFDASNDKQCSKHDNNVSAEATAMKTSTAESDDFICGGGAAGAYYEFSPGRESDSDEETLRQQLQQQQPACISTGASSSSSSGDCNSDNEKSTSHHLYRHDPPNDSSHPTTAKRPRWEEEDDDDDDLFGDNEEGSSDERAGSAKDEDFDDLFGDSYEHEDNERKGAATGKDPMNLMSGSTRSDNDSDEEDDNDEEASDGNDSAYSEGDDDDGAERDETLDKRHVDRRRPGDDADLHDDFAQGGNHPGAFKKKHRGTKRGQSKNGSVSMASRLHDENHDRQSDNQQHETPEFMEEYIGFCCATCRCPQPVANNYFVTQRTGQYHRRCCHGFGLHEEIPKETATAFEAILHRMGDDLENEDPSSELTERRDRDPSSEHMEHLNKESVVKGQNRPRAPRRLANSSWKVKDFNTVKQKKGQAVVLDCFAGIGSGLVVLKRFGIAIQCAIHVECDMIATHVYKYNHLPGYRGNDMADDGIEHIFVDRFEKIDEHFIRHVVRTHGAIDIVLGGAPCVDFSGANANRQGTNGTTGRYQVQLGELIQVIKKINAEFDHDEHVYFFSENVAMDDNHGDLTKVTNAFDLSVADPIQIDAHFYSPVCRDRMYLTNIIMDETLLATHFDDNRVAGIMTDGYQHGALCVDASLRVRFYCLMASFSRIDSDKMKVYKQVVGGEGNEYYCRTLNVKEREAMMGYPPEYVERPTTELFQTLLDEGFYRVQPSMKRWQETLPEPYHIFGGLKPMFRQRQDDTTGYPVIALCYPPPTTGTTIDYFNSEQYSKRLIGNAWSLPVVSIFFKSLQSKFDRRDYPGYSDYRFAWEA